MPRIRTRIALALVSLAVIGLELTMMRVMALRMWHHFAYMVVSVALIGFGASGTTLTLLRSRVQKAPRAWLWALAMAFALSMPLTWQVTKLVELDIEFLAWNFRGMVLPVLLLEFLMFLPFFLAGGLIGVALMDRPERVGGHYAANMVGSGAGSLAAVMLMYHLDTFQLMIALSIIAFIGGAAVVPWRRYRSALPAGATGLALIAALLLADPDPAVSQFKMLSFARDLPATETIASTEGPLGRIDVVRGPGLHYAPGMSLQYTDRIPPQALMITDGDYTTGVYNYKGIDDWRFTDWTTPASAFEFLERPNVLVIGAGGGSDIGMALYRDARSVTALEMNRQVIELMEGALHEIGGRIYSEPQVDVRHAEARGYLSITGGEYDIILAPPMEAFGASGAGLHAAQESYLSTVESFALMANRLSDEGVLSATRWARTPPRDGPRLFATLAEALRSRGLAPESHLAMIRSWSTVTILASKAPFEGERIELLRDFAEERGFDLCYYPGITRDEVNRRHVLDRPYYYEAALALLGPERDAYIENYVFNLSPATDDRPYFNHFFRWRALPVVREQLKGQAPAYLEIGYLMVVASLVQASLLALALIVLPLAPGARRLRGVRRKGAVLFYFLCLGLGFMLLEMGFLQRFILYLAHPIYSAAVVIAGFLVFAGIGSAISARWRERQVAAARCAAGAVVAISIIYMFLLAPWLALTQAAPIHARVTIALLTIAPLALAMGHMFPLGLSRTGGGAPALTPWAWAVNGFASVIGASATPLLAMSFGFSRVTIIAILCYALAGVLFARLPAHSIATGETFENVDH